MSLPTQRTLFLKDFKKFLLKKNIEYLNHNTLTDVITFSNVEKDIISGDIMISIDRVKENSIKFKTEFTTELLRVMVHGVLHLIGYDDTSDAQKKEMRKKEDFYTFNPFLTKQTIKKQPFVKNQDLFMGYHYNYETLTDLKDTLLYQLKLLQEDQEV